MSRTSEEPPHGGVRFTGQGSTAGAPAAAAPTWIGDDPRFSAVLEHLARTPVLLVASDYDGTLAPIVPNPAEARPHRAGLVALEALARLPQTTAAILSGRALEDLAELSGEPVGVRLIGSHGSEFDPGFAASLSPEQSHLRSRLLLELEALGARLPGSLVEPKPAGAAFHYRGAAEELVPELVAELLAGPGAYEGVHLRRGKCVIELSVVATHKGDALEVLRSRAGATAVLFLGDDVTDEDAFRLLCGPDVGVKIGPGDSAARWRCADPEEAARLLARLAEARAEWFAAGSSEPIEQHALLSDLRTAALVTPGGRLTWLCAPRLDSPALFAELLGGPAAGHFSVQPADGSRAKRQSYQGDTLLLETHFDTFRVLDYLDVSGPRPRQRAGRTDLVRVIEGHGRVRIEFAPRLDFGRVPTRMHVEPDGLRIADALDPVLLRAPGVDFQLVREGPHQTAVSEVELGPDPLVLELRFGAGTLGPLSTPESERRAASAHWWSKWAASLRLPKIAPELVRRSALTLRALCHGPTGGIAAAATTSLPEHLGGVRNWDYRFVWLRDAAMTASSLARLGSTREGVSLLDWVLRLVESIDHPERLRPLYLVTGGEVGSEAVLDELPGYRGSRPVRVGNAAASQVQLDVFGPIVDLMLTLARLGVPLSSEHARLSRALVSAVERRWREPDHGIWEIRAAPRHHVHSKTMCWLTLDRGAILAEEYFGDTTATWRALAEEIRAEVLERGFKPSRGAFTAAYDGEDLDAAALVVGLSGLVSAQDPRFVGTVEAIERELRDGPTVYRYRADDGLPGSEGGFHLLAAWLVEAYLAVGRNEDARGLFDELTTLAGPTGLYSEQYDPALGLALGNHPQAYSHLGLIDAALALDRAAPGG